MHNTYPKISSCKELIQFYFYFKLLLVVVLLNKKSIDLLTFFLACRHGNKAGVIETYEAHQGPITGLDVHNSCGSIDYSHLFITSSFDWTIKLWSLKVRFFYAK